MARYSALTLGDKARMLDFWLTFDFPVASSLDTATRRSDSTATAVASMVNSGDGRVTPTVARSSLTDQGLRDTAEGVLPEERTGLQSRTPAIELITSSATVLVPLTGTHSTSTAVVPHSGNNGDGRLRMPSAADDNFAIVNNGNAMLETPRSATQSSHGLRDATHGSRLSFSATLTALSGARRLMSRIPPLASRVPTLVSSTPTFGISEMPASTPASAVLEVPTYTLNQPDLVHLCTPRRRPSTFTASNRRCCSGGGDSASKDRCGRDGVRKIGDCGGKENPRGLLTPAASCNEGDACAICLSPMVAKSGGKPLYQISKCHHNFHRSCLVESRRAGNSNCPSCRGILERGLTPAPSTAERNVAVGTTGQAQRQAIARGAQRARRAVQRRLALNVRDAAVL